MRTEQRFKRADKSEVRVECSLSGGSYGRSPHWDCRVWVRGYRKRTESLEWVWDEQTRQIVVEVATKAWESLRPTQINTMPAVVGGNRR